MTITRSDISAAFDDLSSGARTRESIAVWASSLLKADDDGSLVLQPASDRSALWEAVKYLVGVDLRHTPQEYLHSLDDFRAFRIRHGV